MRQNFFGSVAGAVAACSGAALAALPSTTAAQLAGNLSVTSDYVWRGSSQTRERPAIQGGVRYTHATGLYASVWGSNVKFRPENGATSEFDIVSGWSGRVAEAWALDVYFLRYQYPGSDIGLNWNEINAAVTWRDDYWAAIGRSSNAMASKTAGTYASIGARRAVNDRWRVEGMLARYFLDSAYADSYTHGAIGVVRTFAPFEVRFTLHGTDSAAKRLFPAMAGARAELALQASF